MINKINISPAKQILLIHILLVVVTFAVYRQVNQYDFINFDDNVYITENIHLQSGLTLSGVRWAFSTLHAEFWHPLTWLSLMLDYQLFGLNAGGYHLTNLILHILSTLLLFRLFNRMTGEIWKSAFVAALFALHPLHVESVAWIAERKDVLSAFFWMLTLYLYVYYTEKPDVKRYLPVLLSFACALMSKSMAVTLPVVMILLDYWPLKRFDSKKGNPVLWQFKEKLLFFVLSAVFSFITIYAQRNLFVNSFPVSSRFANAPVSFVTYLEKTLWPHDMAVFYPFSAQLPVWQVVGASLLIIFISIALIMVWKRFPYLIVGWLWYAITILPVIGIVRSTTHSMHDNYTYLPAIGIAVMLAWGIGLLFPSNNIRKKILFPSAIAFLAILSVVTWKQCGYWKNSMELWGHALKVTKDNYLAHYSMGNAYAKIGGYQQAIEEFNEAISLNPYYIDVYNNRGNAYAELGLYQSAIEDFNRIIGPNPDHVNAYYRRNAVYTQMGAYQPAIEDYNEPLLLKHVNAYYNRGVVYAKIGRYQPAIEDYNQALRMKPDYADAFNGRGAVYLTQGNKISGCRDVQKACELGNCGTWTLAKDRGDCR